MRERVTEVRLNEMEQVAQHWRDHDTLSLIDEAREHRLSASDLSEEREHLKRLYEDEYARRDKAEQCAEAAESRLAEVTREREGVVFALDEFAPSNTGLSLPESVALLRTRLCEVRAEIEGKGGWRERLAEITRRTKAWKAAAKRMHRLFARSRDKRCLCEDGKIRVGDGKHWRFSDCPFCKTERRLAEITRRIETLAADAERQSKWNPPNLGDPIAVAGPWAWKRMADLLREVLSSGAGEGR